MLNFLCGLTIFASLCAPQTLGALTPSQVAQGGTGRGTFTASQLLYGNGTNPLSSVGTTSVTASSPLSFSNPIAKVGGSNSVLSLDTSGAWSGNAGTASALAANGTNASAGNAILGVDAAGNAEGAFDVWTQAENTSAAYISGVTADSPLSGAGTAASHLVLSTAGTWSGNAGTASALAADGTNCSAGSYALGVDAAGNSQNCTVATTGTVTAVSVASANGFAGSSSGGATPQLTLSTGITGVLKGNGTAISTAANGTDYTLISANACSAGSHVSEITAAGVITCSADTGGAVTYDAWTHPVAGYSATTSAIGVGTSTAWAFLGVNPTAGISSRSFVVGSSTGTLFEIENDGRVGVGTSTIGTGLMGMFNVESGSSNTSIYHTGTVNGFLESNIQNRSNGASASSDWIATSDNGSATTHYVNLGINGSGGGGTPFTGVNHSYLYSVDDPLNIGALGASAPFITLNVGGGATPIEYARLTGTGTGFGTTTPQWTMTLASSTKPQLTLTDASITSAPFNFRANGNYLTFSTSSPLTFATTSSSFAEFDRSTASTTLLKLSVIGTGTSTIKRGLTIESFVATRAVFSHADKGLVTSAASASLLNSLTDETGTGVAVFGTSPTFTTSIAAVPLISGGAAVGSTLAIQGTSGASPTTASLTLRAASTISPSMTFTTRGIGAGTTTPGYLLNLASSTAPQLALSDGSITAAPWTFRSGNGNFYLATATPTTFATSSNATLNNPFSIIAGGISGLFGFGSSTPWANVGITNTAGIPGFAIGSTTGTSFMVDLLGRSLFGTTTGPAAGYSAVSSSTISSYENRVATSSTTDIPFGGSNMTTVRMGSAAMTLTFSQLWPGAAQTIKICNPNQTVAGALTWPNGATALWDGGTVPTQITTADKCWYVSCRVSVGTSTVAKADCLKAGGTTGF